MRLHYSPGLFFPQDNAFVHVSGDTNAFNKKWGADTLKWPAQLTFLKPIEKMRGACLPDGKQHTDVDKLGRKIKSSLLFSDCSLLCTMIVVS